MSDTSEQVTYGFSAVVVEGGGMWDCHFDINLPISDDDALSIAAAFAAVLPPAPATQISLIRYDRTTVQSYGNLTATPPVFE
jgi:hypothetical protein